MRIPSKAAVKQSGIYKSAVKFCNSNFVAKTIVLFTIWAVVFIPVYIYLLIRWAVGPIGFWQELATLVVCGLAIGWVQALFLFFGVVLSMMIIADEL
jgi:hypothetical protein